MAIKFIADSKMGKYAEEDTGLLMQFTRDYTDAPVGIILLEDDSFVTAPLSDFIMDAENASKIPQQEK